jgi:hypothetical protein
MADSVAVAVERRGEGWVGEVDVRQAGASTHHTVVVSRSDLARWGRGDSDADVEDLVRRSFAFLLEREPATSVLRRFELSVIHRYFPEYDQQLKP